MTEVKVCGLTRPEDVECVLELGVEVLGLNFVPGTVRALELERARDLCARAHGRARCIGVFQDAPLERVRELAGQLALDGVQLHGRESPEYAAALELPVIKVLPGDAVGVGRAPAYASAELLIDHPSGGGSGRSWDFALARELVAAGRQVWIAGGLGPQNVAAAIRAVRPFGVDACSGLESAPGLKDPVKLQQFVERARAALEGEGHGRPRSQSA